MADSSRLGKAIADALIGGTLGGLSAEAGKDFLTPFLQAQREDFDRQDKLEATAISNFSKSMSATGQAIQGNSREAYETRAFHNRVDETTALALSQARTPGAQQLILSTREAAIADGKRIYEADLQKQFIDDATEKHNFAWLTQSDAPGREKSTVAALAAATAPGSVIAQNWAEAQKLELDIKSGSDSGIVQGDLSDMPANDDLKSILTYVRTIKGGLPQYVNENRKEGAALLSLLSNIDAGEFNRVKGSLKDARDRKEVSDRIDISNLNNPDRPEILKSPDNFVLGEDGQVTWNPTQIKNIALGLYEKYTDPSDIRDELRSIGRGVRVDPENTANLINAIVRGVDWTPPSSNTLGRELNQGLTSTIELSAKSQEHINALESSLTEETLESMIARRAKPEAEALLRNNNISPLYYELRVSGPSFLLNRLIDEASSGKEVLAAKQDELEDRIILADAQGDDELSKALSVEQEQIQKYQASSYPNAVNEALMTVLKTAASRDSAEYEAAIMQFLTPLKAAGMIALDAENLGDVHEKALKEIASIDNMVDRVDALGKFLGPIALGPESISAPELSANRDRANMAYTESLSRVVNALSPAIGVANANRLIGEVSAGSYEEVGNQTLRVLTANSWDDVMVERKRWEASATLAQGFREPKQAEQQYEEMILERAAKESTETSTPGSTVPDKADTGDDFPWEKKADTEEAVADTKAPVTELSAEERKAEKARVEESLRNVHSEAIKKRVAEKSSAKAAELTTLQESWEKKKKPTLLTPSKFSGFPGNYPLVGESNVLLGTVEFGGVHVVAPTMRDGKQMEEHEILEMIFTESGGFGNTRIGFPKFKTEKAAQAWIKKNHGKISEDGRYTGRSK